MTILPDERQRHSTEARGNAKPAKGSRRYGNVGNRLAGRQAGKENRLDSPFSNVIWPFPEIFCLARPLNAPNLIFVEAGSGQTALRTVSCARRRSDSHACG